MKSKSKSLENIRRSRVINKHIEREFYISQLEKAYNIGYENKIFTDSLTEFKSKVRTAFMKLNKIK